jgi:antitoxin (DNA-binding transcriptional repressor) of toxin-antitoxin stability system
MLAVQPVARLASVLQVRRISSPMTLAVWARINSYNFHRPHRQTHPGTSAD